MDQDQQACVVRQAGNNVETSEKKEDISDSEKVCEENAKALEGISISSKECEIETERQTDTEQEGAAEKLGAVAGVEETKTDEDLKTDGDVPPRRVVRKKGRSLIPPKETTEAPQNFVDVPDYGYIGIDGSYQVPF